MKKFAKFSLILSTLFFLPHIASAQLQPRTPRNFQEFADIVLNILSLAAPLVIFISFIIFFWGLAIFILKADEEDKRKSGKTLMIWGIIALFIAISTWALVGILYASVLGSEFKFLPQLRTK